MNKPIAIIATRVDNIAPRRVPRPELGYRKLNKLASSKTWRILNRISALQPHDGERSAWESHHSHTGVQFQATGFV